MKDYLVAILALVIIGGFIFAIQYASIMNYSFFAPKMENAKREVFVNTDSYVAGKRQELTKYRLEYITTKDEDVKAAIKMTIIQSFANFDKNHLNYELRTFLDSLTY